MRPHFAPLGGVAPAPILIFLEDTSLLAEKVQQSKLAALGRLSASIAHEIRNPVGAMSHAGQLLAESQQLPAEDRRLTEIIRTNAGPGELDHQQRAAALPARGSASGTAHRSAIGSRGSDEEFCETMQWPAARLQLSGPRDAIEVRADPGQLRQVVWNLCDNAIKHAVKERRRRDLEIRYGRLSPIARPFLEVSDRGPGVTPENAERIFEPFFSDAPGGTGLGLFLARELAQTSGATLLYEPRPGGGSIFRLVFADPHRWGELR